MASSTRLSLASKQFFIVGTAISCDPSLGEFFRTYCGATRVQVLEAGPAQFVTELHQRWRERNPQVRAVEAPPAASRQHFHQLRARGRAGGAAALR